MKKFLSILLMSTLMSGCAATLALNGVAASVVHQAIVDSENLHCGSLKAPPAPVCLSDAQFEAVNKDFAKMSQAGLTYTNIVKAAQAAKTQPAAQAIATVVQAFSDGIQDVETILGPSSTANTLVADLQAALKAL